MIDPLDKWKKTLNDLSKSSDPVWATKFANWYAERIANIAPDPSFLTAVGFVFAFPTPAFASALMALPPTTSAPAGIAGYAAAWETSILSIVYPVGISVSSGSSIPPTAPPTTFSAVTSVLIDPSSIAAGKAKILELINSKPVSNSNDSQFPIKFREATLMLKINVSGMNSQPPTPVPLVAMNVPLV